MMDSPSEMFLAAYSVVMGLYTPQLLQFWIRGSSVGFGTTVFLVNQVPTAMGVQVATAITLAIGILYPWNAKWNMIGEKLPVKYPMHYVPEVLMAVLSAGGLYAIASDAGLM